MKILFWPFIMLWGFIGLLLSLLGRMLTGILGLVFMIVGGVVTLTVIGAVVGVPLAILGALLVGRALF